MIYVIRRKSDSMYWSQAFGWNKDYRKANIVSARQGENVIRIDIGLPLADCELCEVMPMLNVSIKGL